MRNLLCLCHPANMRICSCKSLLEIGQLKGGVGRKICETSLAQSAISVSRVQTLAHREAFTGAILPRRTAAACHAQPDGVRLQRPISMSEENIAEIIQSFDCVMSDCDGVLWHFDGPIANSFKTISHLRSLGKRIFYVTNNAATFNNEMLAEKLKEYDTAVQPEDCVCPSVVLIEHLKAMCFKKKVMIFGTKVFRNTVREAGFAVRDPELGTLDVECFAAFKAAMRDDPDVGAVVVDFDYNLSYLELMRAAVCLRRRDCHFFVGATEDTVAVDRTLRVIGPGHISRILQDMSGRTPTFIGKPSTAMVDYLTRRHDIPPERTLFIGDSIQQDIGVADAAGFKSLLVSPDLNVEDIQSDLVPDFVAPSLGHIAHLLDILDKRRDATASRGSQAGVRV